MYSTYPHIAQYTKKTLEAACKAACMSTDRYRLGTLKRVECEIANLLESAENELIAESVDELQDLLNQVRIAIGED